MSGTPKGLATRVGRVTKEVYSGAELLDRSLLSRDRADIRARMFQAVIIAQRLVRRLRDADDELAEIIER